MNGVNKLVFLNVQAFLQYSNLTLKLIGLFLSYEEIQILWIQSQGPVL